MCFIWIYPVGPACTYNTLILSQLSPSHFSPLSASAMQGILRETGREREREREDDCYCIYFQNAIRIGTLKKKRKVTYISVVAPHSIHMALGISSMSNLQGPAVDHGGPQRGQRSELFCEPNNEQIMLSTKMCLDQDSKQRMCYWS